MGVTQLSGGLVQPDQSHGVHRRRKTPASLPAPGAFPVAFFIAFCSGSGEVIKKKGRLLRQAFLWPFFASTDLWDVTAFS